ncbi:MAG: MFS transporter [Planctomycetota bacterium]|jgi:UMF1 family MFS transporter
MLGIVPTGMKLLTITLLIVLFALANFSFQSALVFYNSLLPEIASDKRMGLVSGLGIGIGYFGNLVGGGLALLLVPMFGKTAESKEVIWPMFLITGVLFFLFALPCFFCVPERYVKNPEKLRFSIATSSFRNLMKTLAALPKHPVVMLFLIGNFLCMDALNTTVVCAARTLIEILGLGRMETMKVLLGFSGAALVVGLLLGKLIDIIGSWKVFFISCASFMIALITCVIVHNHSAILFIGAFIAFGPIGLAGIQSAGRKILVELAPPEKIGEYFGLFGLTNKVSALGVLAFFLITDALQPGHGSAFAYRIALASLLGFIIPGTICAVIAAKIRVKHGDG